MARWRVQIRRRPRPRRPPRGYLITLSCKHAIHVGILPELGEMRTCPFHGTIEQVTMIRSGRAMVPL